MSADEIIEFLTDVEKSIGVRDDTYPYVEKYLEGIVSSNDSPDRFYTNLANIYIDKLF